MTANAGWDVEQWEYRYIAGRSAYNYIHSAAHIYIKTTTKYPLLISIADIIFIHYLLILLKPQTSILYPFKRKKQSFKHEVSNIYLSPFQ